MLLKSIITPQIWKKLSPRTVFLIHSSGIFYPHFYKANRSITYLITKSFRNNIYEDHSAKVFLTKFQLFFNTRALFCWILKIIVYFSTTLFVKSFLNKRIFHPHKRKIIPRMRKSIPQKTYFLCPFKKNHYTKTVFQIHKNRIFNPPFYKINCMTKPFVRPLIRIAIMEI